MVSLRAYEKYLAAKKGEGEKFGEEIISFEKFERSHKPRSFYQALEEYVIQTIKSGKYVGLERFAKKKPRPGQKLKKGEENTTTQKIWVEDFDAGRKLRSEDIFMVREITSKGVIRNPSMGLLKAESYKRWLIKIGKYEDFINTLKKDWIETHQKFITFCEGVKKDLMEHFKKERKNVVASPMKGFMEELDKFHKKTSGGLDIHSEDEIVVGLQYCLEKVVKVRTTPDKEYIIFTKLGK